ncbi:MAG: Ni/Fe hydrogenase subunit alpha [archaeon]
MKETGHFAIKEITKIEGHANLDVEMDSGKVKKCELQIFEGQRFFESMLSGRDFSQVPLIVSRICGLCNVSHLNTAMKAVEKAFGVEASEQTLLLRQLATNGEFIKSHALHLFFLVLPDFLGRESVLDFGKEEQKFLLHGIALKKAGTEMVKLIGGRIYQTVAIRPGGFTALPEEKQLGQCLRLLEKERPLAIEAIRLFASFRDSFPFQRKTEYLALADENYSFVKGTIQSSTGLAIKDEEMTSHVHERILPYSNAKQASLGGREFRVGSLARINLNQKALEPAALDLMQELGLKFPSHTIFDNNLAQAIELLHLFDSSIRILKDFKLKKEPAQQISPCDSTGIGVTEAPRGTLYHEYKFDSKGIVQRANIIVPTNQNAHTIESDLVEFIPSLLDLPQEKANLEIEKLVRAYDPCISCATHFLKVKWKKN